MRRKDRSEMKVITGGNQMSLIRDTEEVIKFLEFAGRKNILNDHAINCRLTACNNLFSTLNEDEDSLDFILGNLDVLINRFRNKNQNVQASTLKVYKSRVKSSVEDFKAWSADPFAWERAISDKAKAAGLESRREKQIEKQQAIRPVAPPRAARRLAAPKEPVAITTPVVLAEMSSEPEESNIETPVLLTVSRPNARGQRRVSFPIRPDFCVEMVLPEEGITLKELQRLGLFLYPYCNDIEPDPTKSPFNA